MSQPKHKIFKELSEYIDKLELQISPDRKGFLKPLIEYINYKISKEEPILLNFICTHNSRRSHLAQVWAHTMAVYYSVKNVTTYSGGTEATALFPMIAQTLKQQGFEVTTISDSENPVYAIKYAKNDHPIIGFSKVYNDNFNPDSNFAAVLTCDHADVNCPNVRGAEKRISITYEDPKVSDGTSQQEATYLSRSLQIAQEMKYVFSKVSSL